MLMPHIGNFILYSGDDAGTGEFLLFGFLIISGAFVTQYIRTKKKLLKWATH